MQRVLNKSNPDYNISLRKFLLFIPYRSAKASTPVPSHLNIYAETYSLSSPCKRGNLHIFDVTQSSISIKTKNLMNGNILLQNL